MSLSLLLSLICIAGICTTQSLDYEIEKVSLPGEMANFTGTGILQDRDGFMWFGSLNGLYRYDGASFRNFLQDPQLINEKGVAEPAPELINEPVVSFFEARDGSIWFTNGTDLIRFDRFTGYFSIHSDTSGTDPSTIKYLIEGKGDLLWYSHNRGLCRFNRNSGTFRHYSIEGPDIDSPIGKGVWCIFMDSDGLIWVQYGNNGIAVFNPETETYRTLDNTPDQVISLSEDHWGNIWIFTRFGLYSYNRDQDKIERIIYEPKHPGSNAQQVVWNLLDEPQGNYWMNTQDGIHLLDEKFQKLGYWHYPNNFEVRWLYFFLQDPAKSLCLDRQGIIWFFTNDGIYKLFPADKKFRILPSWAYQYAAIRIIDEAGHVRPFQLVDYFLFHIKLMKNAIPGSRINLEGSLEGTWLRTALMDHRGGLWIACEEGILYQENMSSESVTFRVIHGDTSIKHLYEDSNGRIWMKPEGQNPCYYDRQEDRIIYLAADKDGDSMPVDLHIAGELKSGTLLGISKEEGLFSISLSMSYASGDSAAVTAFTRLLLNQQDAVHGIQDIHVSGSGQELWMLRGKLGLLRTGIRENGNEIRLITTGNYTVINGLPSKDVRSLVEDRRGYIWLGLDGGLSRLDPVNETFTNFYKEDGLPTNSFKKAAFEDNTGRLYFGTEVDFISFYPDSIQINQQAPSVYITSLSINHKDNRQFGPGTPDSLVSYCSKIDLIHSQNNLSIQFAALNFLQSRHNQYRYRMDGYDADWIQAGNRTHVDYTNLPPGIYQFQVMGSNSDGVWNDQPASLQIRIGRPPWGSWYAYAVYFLLLAGLTLWIWHYLRHKEELRLRIESERLEKEKIVELDHTKTRFFANISHEFRTPLTLIKGPVEDLLNSNHNKSGREIRLLELIRNNTYRLDQLVNQLLTLSRLDAGHIKLRVSAGDLALFIEHLTSMFQSIAESKKIMLILDLEKPGGKTYFDREKTERIFTNLLSNALKYTPENGKVFVTLEFRSDEDSPENIRAVLKVRDTGPGIPQNQTERIFERYYRGSESSNGDQAGFGIGLALCKELAALHRAEILVENRRNPGACFTLTLPVSKAFFTGEEILVLQDEDDKHPVHLISGHEPRSEMPQSGAKKIPASELPLVLVVEDHPEMREYIMQHLYSEFRTIGASDGSDGYEVAIREIPDLIISDLMMPEKDGLEMCRLIRDDPRTDHIPFLMLTARADRISEFSSYLEGADDYVLKPFDAELLLLRVRNLVEQRNRLRQKYRKEFWMNSESIEEKSDEHPFLEKIGILLEKSLDEPDYNVEQLCRDVGLSQSQLYRKLKALTDQSPVEYLRSSRLKKAAAMFLQGHRNVSSVLYSVGFNSPSQFSRYFREAYGMNPSRFIKTHAQKPE